MSKFLEKMKQPNIAVPFWTTIVVGILTHFPVMIHNFPNSDAMTSFYFDQNMVTSGRWFLTVACGISSFFDLKWINGLLSILYFALAAVVLVRILEIKSKTVMGLIAATLVTFPAVTATYAYMYTADGYFLGFFFAVLAVYLTKKMNKTGWALGAIALSLSLGTYQAYLAATILLCLFDLILMCAQNEKIKAILIRGVKYFAMGALGGILYYVILQICLKAQGKVLDTYQGINNMGKVSVSSMPGMIVGAIKDFFGFLRNGRIFLTNGFSYIAVVLLFGVSLLCLVTLFVHTKAIKKWYLSLLVVVFVAIIPIGTNVIILISSEAYYHLLMRMQWGLFPIFALCLIDRMPKGETRKARPSFFIGAAGLLGGVLLIWQFILADNIAYFNMNERYEKTYAYCVRLADRIEQTEGYYTGIPVMMIGVLDEEKYPVTDITGDVTERISGTTGDMLIYKGEQYQAFMEHYLNFSLNVITDSETIIDIYNSDAYREMDSFPAKDSIKIVDGIMYIKTEPPEGRDTRE